MSVAIEIRPQPGPQELALSLPVDILITGGAKGGGKSWTGRLATTRYLHVPGFHAVVFRREKEQVTKAGGQWDKSFEIYPYVGGIPKRSELRWYFEIPSSLPSTVSFSHLNEDKDCLSWYGTEVALYFFDQLEEFTKFQFLQILGCMRTTSGVPTQIVASCNPDAESWLAELVDPWIADDGYVDLDLDGTIRHLTVEDGNFVWVDADWRDDNGQPPQSIAYVSADIWSNKKLLESDPKYLSNLMSQSLVDRERFLGQKGRGGNWKIKAEAGKVFQSGWFEMLQAPPLPIEQGTVVRFWDFAATEKDTRGKDPDWTVGFKFVWYPQLHYGVILDVVRTRSTPDQVNRLFVQTAHLDGVGCEVSAWQDPGQAGVSQMYDLRSQIPGFTFTPVLARFSKYTYAKPVSAAAEQGKIKMLVNQSWNTDVISTLVAYPDGSHEDDVDSLSGAYGLATGSLRHQFKQGHIQA